MKEIMMITIVTTKITMTMMIIVSMSTAGFTTAVDDGSVTVEVIADDIVVLVEGTLVAV